MAASIPATCPQCKEPTKDNLMTNSMGDKVCKSCGYKFANHPVLPANQISM